MCSTTQTSTLHGPSMTLCRQSLGRFGIRPPTLACLHRFTAVKLRDMLMWNHSILVAGLLLSSSLPTLAQTPAMRIVLVQTPVGLNAIPFSAPRFRFPPAVLPIQLPGKPLLHPEFLSVSTYKPEPSLGSRLQIDEVHTPLLTESRVLIAHLWQGLQVDVLDSTLHSPGVRLGSAGLAGISLSYSFRRIAETQRPGQIWRCVSWFTGNVRGCPL
jgi:hypothetical protein